MGSAILAFVMFFGPPFAVLLGAAEWARRSKRRGAYLVLLAASLPVPIAYAMAQYTFVIGGANKDPNGSLVYVAQGFMGAIAAASVAVVGLVVVWLATRGHAKSPAGPRPPAAWLAAPALVAAGTVVWGMVAAVQHAR